MNRTAFLVGASALALLAGCDARPNVVGEWQTEQANQVVRIQFEEDSTFVMRMADFDGEGTYSVTGDELVLQPTGALATVIPGGFRGSLEGRAMNLCNPAGICTEFERVR